MNNFTMSKIIKIASYIYIMLPLFLFFALWIKPLIALILCIVLCVSFWKALKDDAGPLEFTFNRKKILIAIGALSVICIWVYWSGIGGFVWQNADHTWRNELFKILVEYQWPVSKEVIVEDTVYQRGLVYYIGFWMPAAIIGKIFGLNAGFIAQFLWAVLGVFLAYYYICSYLKKWSLWPVLGMIFFSGLDYVGAFVVDNAYQFSDFTVHMENWSRLYQYSSFSTQLFWVFNQAIYAWIITLMILAQKNNKNVVLLWGCSMFSATLPFVGLIPFVIYKVVENGWKPFDKRAWVELLSIQNVLGGGCVGIISFLYFLGNKAINTTSVAVGNSVKSSVGLLVFCYLVFLFFEVGIYFIVIFKHNYKKPLYYVALVTLLVIPMVRFGGYNEFCMRASIPGLVVLFVLMLETLYNVMKNKKYIGTLAVLIVFILGSKTPINELVRTVVYTQAANKYDGGVELQYGDEDITFLAPNFSGDITDGLFNEYLRK